MLRNLGGAIGTSTLEAFVTKREDCHSIIINLPRCHADDPGESTTCWPVPESTATMNTSRVGRLGPSDAAEDAIVSFMLTLSDGYFSRDTR
jgi:hypothetical protein